MEEKLKCYFKLSFNVQSSSSRLKLSMLRRYFNIPLNTNSSPKRNKFLCCRALPVVWPFCIWVGFKAQTGSILRKARVRCHCCCTATWAPSSYQPMGITMLIMPLPFSVLLWVTPGVFNWSKHTICASRPVMEKQSDTSENIILCPQGNSWRFS